MFLLKLSDGWRFSFAAYMSINSRDLTLCFCLRYLMHCGRLFLRNHFRIFNADVIIPLLSVTWQRKSSIEKYELYNGGELIKIFIDASERDI